MDSMRNSMITKNSYLLFALLLIICIPVFAQQSISGKVVDFKETPLINAHIKLTPSDIATTSDTQGVFKIDNLDDGTYTITITYLGSKTYEESIQISGANIELSVTMEEDPINLDNVIITGSQNLRRQMESGVSITTLSSNSLQNQFSIGTADLLQNIPGIITDPAAGEVFTRVYSRGLSASAQDDLGWYYVSLQEDGLPVSLVQHSYYGPDIFHRLDLMTEKVEVIRGGNSVISAANAPGGIFNFVSHGASNSLRGKFQLDGGLQGDQNTSFKLDGLIQGRLAEDWFFNFGGHYRRDEGARNTDFTFSKGGQFKFNIIKETKSGFIKLYGKILDDYTNRYTGVAAVNWDNPEATFGQDFNTTALMMPSFNGRIPDGRGLENGDTNSFNPANGVHAQDFAFGFNFEHEFENNWTLRYNGKFSNKLADWQTSISNAFVSLSDPLAYFISGAEFPIGQIVFKDAQTDTEIARVNNSGILAGESFEYLNGGSLPNDAIMGTSAWYKNNKANEWIDQLQINKVWKNHDFNVGTSLGISNSSLFTQGSFAYVTYEPNPRMLEVTVENPNEDIVHLSDSHGLSNYGGLFFINGEANVRQLSAFANDRYKINEKLTADIGLRYENINHSGFKDRFEPFQREGGLDMDVNTAYDNGILTPNGIRDDFNYTYDYLSLSAGINYQLSNDYSVFASYSYGNKAPELDYYFNNFSNVPITNKGEIQRISLYELGLKYRRNDFSTTFTGFLSELSNIGISNFEFDAEDDTIFFTPIQFNSSRSIGLEWESAYSPISDLTFKFNGTIQDTKARNWTIYDASETVDPSDDVIIDYSGNTLPLAPRLDFKIKTEYQINKLNAFVKWYYTSERQGNIANAFQLPSYSLFSLGVAYDFTENLSANLAVTNVFNSAGLNNFFGANVFGGNANGVTSEFIQSNPNASFIVVPVLPRRTILRLSYYL